MSNITAIEFVNKINKSISYYNITKELDYLNEILIPKPKRKDLRLTGEFLEDLYRNYDLNGRVIGFDFLKELDITSEYIFFALNDPFYIGLQKKTDEIIIFDPKFDKVHLKLAKNLEEFIDVIFLIFDYSLDGWIYEKKYSKDDRNLLLLKIKEIVDLKYLTFYEQSYGN